MNARGSRKWLVLGLLASIAFMSSAAADNSATQSPGQAYVNPLKWLDTADLDQVFNADIKAGITKFYVYCGFGCVVPGVESNTALACYPTALYRLLEGSSDAVVGDDDLRLQHEAAKFAVDYNNKLAQYLTAKDLSKCQPGEHWNGTVRDLDESFSGFNMSDNPKEWADSSYDKKTRRFRFAAYLLAGHRNDGSYKKICSVLEAHKLSGKVIVELYDAPSRNALSSIACENGAVEPSDWKPKPGDYPELPGFDDGADAGT